MPVLTFPFHCWIDVPRQNVRHTFWREYPVFTKHLKDTSLANDYWTFSRNGRFWQPGVSRRCEASPPGCATFWHFSDPFLRNPHETRGYPDLPSRGEKADHNTEGGLRSVPGGLAYSEVPCAQVLSVSELLALLGLFLLGREEYSEGKEAPFLRGEPGSPWCAEQTSLYRIEHRSDDREQAGRRRMYTGWAPYLGG